MPKSSRLGRFVVRAGIAFACALFVYNIRGELTLAYYKLSGQTVCPWNRLMSAAKHGDLMRRYRSELSSAVRSTSQTDFRQHTPHALFGEFPNFRPNEDSYRSDGQARASFHTERRRIMASAGRRSGCLVYGREHSAGQVSMMSFKCKQFEYLTNAV